MCSTEISGENFPLELLPEVRRGGSIRVVNETNCFIAGLYIGLGWTGNCYTYRRAMHWPPFAPPNKLLRAVKLGHLLEARGNGKDTRGTIVLLLDFF